MATSLAPNRIHSLPVRVTYIVHPSRGIFSTTFNKPQQVYVHPNAGSVCVDGTDEAWGSIPLKAIVKGVLTSSPELHPAHSQTADLSVYVHDPRETYLRRSRISTSPEFSSNTIEQAAEVWTGKGLVSWALGEKGEGNTLITGRVVFGDSFANPLFADSNDDDSGLSALEKLARAQEAITSAGTEVQKGWGIEVSISFQNGSSADGKPTFPGPLHPTIEREALSNPTPAFPYPRSASSPAQFDHRVYPTTQPHRASLAHPTPSRLHSEADSHSSSPVHAPASASKSGRRVYVPRSKKSSPLHEAGRGKLAHLDPNSSTRLVGSSASSSDSAPTAKRAHLGVDGFPTDIPASIFVKPASMTKEQAERLLESPAFLDMLETLTGAPVRTKQAAKRAAEEHAHPQHPASEPAGPEKVAKRAKYDGQGRAPGSSYFEDVGELKCWICGTTKSSVWRTKKIESEKAVRVCNACGLYYNKTRTLRPPNLWNTDSDRKSAPAGSEPSSSTGGHLTTPSASHRIPMSTPGGTTPTGPTASASMSRKSSGSSTFKRTLTMVAEKDAQRIAASKKKLGQFRAPGQQTPVKVVAAQNPSSAKAAAFTSTPGSVVRPKGRQPGSGKKPDAAPQQSQTGTNPSRPYTNQPKQLQTPQVPSSDRVNSDLVSPNTAIQRILANATGDAVASGMQSLAMPLSDDDAPQTQPQVSNAGQHQWTADFSALFDVEGFAPTYGGVGSSQFSENAASVSPNQTLESDLHGVSSIVRPRPATGLSGLGVGLTPGSKGLVHGFPAMSGLEPDGNQIFAPHASEDEDDVLSQLFKRTSSVGEADFSSGGHLSISSPTAFDFSQLPPSSPPMTMGSSPPLQRNALSHSALLLSSPGSTASPVEVDMARSSSRNGSGLRHSISANAGYEKFESAPTGQQYMNNAAVDIKVHPTNNGNGGVGIGSNQIDIDAAAMAAASEFNMADFEHLLDPSSFVFTDSGDVNGGNNGHEGIDLFELLNSSFNN